MIVGSSDSGKTAIFRAFKWLMYNRPLGSGFRSNWGGQTKVILQLDDNHAITRWKDDSAQGYIVDKQKLGAIKADVPDEVVKILRMTDINFQQQFDHPFLLDESPGAVAAHFNRISKLESIDRTIANLKKEERELKRAQQTNDKLIQELQSKLDKLSWLHDVEQLLAIAEGMETTKNELKEKYIHLRTILGTLKELGQEEQQLKTVLDLEPELKSVQKLIQQRDTTKTQYLDIKEKIQQLQLWNKEIKDINGLLKLEQWVQKADDKITQCDQTRAEKMALQTLIEQIKQEEQNLIQASTAVDRAQQNFDKVFPDVCPLCGSRKEGTK